MTQFYKVIRGQVLHDSKNVYPGGFIYATPEEMDGVVGVGSVIQVDKSEVSVSFLQEKKLLHLVIPQQEIPVLQQEVKSSLPILPPIVPTTQNINPPDEVQNIQQQTIKPDSQTTLGLGLSTPQEDNTKTDSPVNPKEPNAKGAASEARAARGNK